jgi:hypothetical protein
MWKQEKLNELTRLPGVGNSIARDLWNLGIRNVDDLKGKSPEKLYEQSNDLVGTVQDRCLLYVFRCAVYYAETVPGKHEKEKLNWWYWKGKEAAFTTDDKRRPPPMHRRFLKLLSLSLLLMFVFLVS